MWHRESLDNVKGICMHAGDNRLAIIATLFLPVVGWVRMLLPDIVCCRVYFIMKLPGGWLDHSPVLLTVTLCLESRCIWERGAS